MIPGMDHADHVSLIRRGVHGAGPRWLELGSGEGAFTLALADVLGSNGSIHVLDRDARALGVAAASAARRFPDIEVIIEGGDFTQRIPAGPFDGVLAANCLHFVRDRRPVLGSIIAALRPGGHVVIVEYDADHGNPWVPHPFSIRRCAREALAAGFMEPQMLERVPSRFLGGIYGAVAIRPPEVSGLG